MSGTGVKRSPSTSPLRPDPSGRKRERGDIIRITSYNVCYTKLLRVPSTWNAGPRDTQGQAGAYEAALQDNHQLADVKQPVEILRTIHSFDPCIACAVHLFV